MVGHLTYLLYSLNIVFYIYIIKIIFIIIFEKVVPQWHTFFNSSIVVFHALYQCFSWGWSRLEDPRPPSLIITNKFHLFIIKHNILRVFVICPINYDESVARLFFLFLWRKGEGMKLYILANHSPFPLSLQTIPLNPLKVFFLQSKKNYLIKFLIMNYKK